MSLNDPRNFPVGKTTLSQGSMRWPIETSDGLKYAVATRILHSGQVIITDESGAEWTPSWDAPHLHHPYTEDEGE